MTNPQPNLTTEQKRNKKILELCKRKEKERDAALKETICNPSNDLHPDLLRKLTDQYYQMEIDKGNVEGEKLEKALNYIIANLALSSLHIQCGLGGVSVSEETKDSLPPLAKLLHNKIKTMIENNYIPPAKLTK